MRNFKPVKQPRISDVIFQQLKNAILANEFKAGDRLTSEKDLAEQFQVSRVAVREAIRTLENAGFVAIRQGLNGGAYVTDLTFEHLANACLDLFLANKISIHELHHVRILIEPEVARLAAVHTSPEWNQRLLKAYKAEHPAGASLSEDIASATRVHILLAEMCGNRFLEALVNSLLKMTKNIIEEMGPNPPNSIHPPGLHGPIIDAVLAGDPDAAAAAMKTHARVFYDNLVRMEKDYREHAPGGIEMAL